MKTKKCQVTFNQDGLYTPFFVKAADEEQAIRKVALQLERPVQKGAKLFDVRENTVSWDDGERSEIAPCLFCLSESPFLDLAYNHMFRVVCSNCGASGPTDPFSDESINRWNRAWAASCSQNEAELAKPEKEKCPFCRGAHLSVAKDDRLYEDYIQCANCHAGGSTAETPFEKDAETRAINKWNRAWKHLREARGSGIPLSLIKHPASTHLVELETLFWALLS